MMRFINFLFGVILNSALDLDDDVVVVIIVVVSIIAVSIIGAIFYAKKDE